MLTIAPHATPLLISNATEHFNKKYHDHYASALRLRKNYFFGAIPVLAHCTPLAQELVRILKAWGAGRRKAPVLESVSAIAIALSNASLHGKLKRLAAVNVANFTMTPAGKAFVAEDHLYTDVKAFDHELGSVLKDIASKFFIGTVNSSTYPMKVLLLITGFIPALDSQVRKGLQNIGMRGFSSPLNIHKPSDLRKICTLPFVIGHLLNNSAYASLLSRGVARSKHASAMPDIGRQMDVLWFVQANPSVALSTFLYV